MNATDLSDEAQPHKVTERLIKTNFYLKNIFLKYMVHKLEIFAYHIDEFLKVYCLILNQI